MTAHFPLALGITGSGAAMVSLVEHADAVHAPAATAWLLGAAVALMLASTAIVTRTLVDAEREPEVYRPLAIVLLLGALAALGVGAWQPGPLPLVLALAALLIAIWWFAVDRWLRARPEGETLG